MFEMKESIKELVLANGKPNPECNWGDWYHDGEE